jgi:hypothetical protein
LTGFVESLAGAGAPLHLLAALEALTFGAPSTARMARLSEAQQNRFLQWCDQRQLTLLIYHRCKVARLGTRCDHATEGAV